MFVSESSTSLGFVDPPPTYPLPARCFTRYCSSRISFPRALLMRSFGFFFVPRCLSITVTVMSHNHAKFIPMRCLSLPASYPLYSVSSFSCVSKHRLKTILSLQQTFPPHARSRLRATANVEHADGRADDGCLSPASHWPSANSERSFPVFLGLAPSLGPFSTTLATTQRRL